MNYLHLLIVLLSVALLVSCAISPSLQAPAKPMNKDEVSVQASFEAMPVIGINNRCDPGTCLVGRYGINDRFTGQLKLWKSLGQNLYNPTYEYGVSFMPTFYLSNQNDDFQFFITPNITLLQNKFKFEFGSFGSYYGVMFPKVLFFNSYLAGSFHGVWQWGKSACGIGATINGGIRIPVYKSLDFNFEVTYSWLQYSLYGSPQKFTTPTLGLGYSF